MSMLDNAIGLQATTMKIRSERSVVLANNIANAETPNFKARDYDFKDALAQARGDLEGDGGMSRSLARTSAGHMSLDEGGLSTTLGYRVPTQAASDGNTVETHVEKTQFAENASRYVADLTFLKSRVSGLIRAMGDK
ncbi:MAG: flagellar basal body rod protein FlgB [Gammaproteobacteria bacterium]|nr:flagellar basal body rod protein FlgB [Gammaproteobacteria bacterium]